MIFSGTVAIKPNNLFFFNNIGGILLTHQGNWQPFKLQFEDISCFSSHPQLVNNACGIENFVAGKVGPTYIVLVWPESQLH